MNYLGYYMTSSFEQKTIAIIYYKLFGIIYSIIQN